MNTTLTVKKSADTNFVPVMYRAVEITVGANAAGTYVLLECVRVGWDTEAHYNAWKSTRQYDSGSGTTTLVGRKVTGVQGTVGALEVVTLAAIVAYNTATPSTDM